MGYVPLVPVTLAALASLCFGGNVESPDLAKALRASDTVIVGRVISGEVREDSTVASAKLLVNITRVIEGSLTRGRESGFRLTESASTFRDRPPEVGSLVLLKALRRFGSFIAKRENTRRFL